MHCVDNNNKPANCIDKLYKIRTLYDLLRKIWKDMYNPGEYTSIDEGMLKWRGRLSFRVYNKNKPIKYGIKSYILCDSANAYCWALDVYASKGMKLEETICRLLDTCLHKWHSLYMDNFYNSVELAESLLSDQVHTVGTMRTNRGEGNEVSVAGSKGHKLMRGETVARDNGKVMTICWMDKKPVRALSTKHDGSMIEITRRKKEGMVKQKKFSSQFVIVTTTSTCRV